MRSKKIYVNKSDEAALVVEKIIESRADEVVLSIPKFSKIGASERNFHLLKREADDSGKNIFIESVDDAVVSTATKCGLSASNPFFEKAEKKFTDIVPTPKLRRVSRPVTLVGAKFIPEPRRYERPDEESDEGVVPNPDTPEDISAEIDQKFGPPTEPGGAKSSAFKFLAIFSLIAVSGALSFLALWVFPAAEIKITTKKANYSYDKNIIVDKSSRAPDGAAMKVPGQIFTDKRNVALTFPATGKKQVEKKSGGTITVYNSFSSAPQSLVGSTRFATADGKVYRLAKSLVVPGAKVVDGKIKPSSVEAQVTADKAGADYNIQGGVRFTIPGFKGTKKYDAFYAEAKEGLKGGFIGEMAYPTDEDIKKAKTALATSLEENLKQLLVSRVPKDFTVVPGSLSFKIMKQTVNTEVNDAKLFSIFAEAEMTVMAFREADALAAFTERMTREVPDYPKVVSSTISYREASLDLGAGKMTLAVDFRSVLEKSLKLDELKQQMLGKSEDELKQMLLGVEELASAQIALKPFYVRHVPRNENKVAVTAD